MNIKLILVSPLIGTIGLTVPVTAQIRNPSQDFFDRGREQLEREIQVLQGESLNLQGNLEQRPSEPILEVSPSPSDTPDAVETPNQPPNPVDNPEQQNQ